MFIPALRPGEHTVQQGQSLALRAGWAACTRGLVQTFIHGSGYRVWLDGELLLEPDDIDALWGPIEPYACPPEGCSSCVPKSQPRGAWWQYALPELAVGTHYVHTVLWLDHPMTDGGDYDEDGRPDLGRPDGYLGDAVVTIIVEE